MDHDLSNQRARKLIATYNLTDAEVRQIIAVARLQLATFDPAYRANVSQLADELDRSRPTLYSWADQTLAATVRALRAVRPGRPPHDPRRPRDRQSPAPAPRNGSSVPATASGGARHDPTIRRSSTDD
jgi:hypothetical protein